MRQETTDLETLKVPSKNTPSSSLLEAVMCLLLILVSLAQQKLVASIATDTVEMGKFTILFHADNWKIKFIITFSHGLSKDSGKDAKNVLVIVPQIQKYKVVINETILKR